MKHELVEVRNAPLTAGDVRANVNLIQGVMKSVMKQDVHFGIIPGTKKPTLYKAGSEKILATFRIAVDLDVEDLSDGDSFRYRVKARGLLPDGTVVGCGIGECSTNEEKYKWRGAVCDEEFDDTPENRRRVKYATKWNGRNKDTVKIKQVRTEPADLANTVLKMAKKRAQIDLTLTATGASDVFDQDIEDLPAEYVEEHFAAEPQGGKPATEAPKAKPQEGVKTATEGQIKMLHAKMKAASVTPEAFCQHFQVATVEALPFDRVTEAAKAIEGGQIHA
jgi:hypothetical protein